MGDKENSKIRITALLKELDRQQLEVKKKKNLIRVIVSVSILVPIIFFSFVYLNSDKNESPLIQVERIGGDIVKEKEFVEKPFVEKQVKTFQLVFKNYNQYPLARFFSEKEVVSFQQEIKKLNLPKTFIYIDSLKGKERVLEISSNYRYYIQFGIFRNQLLSDLPDNMIYLHQIKDKNLYKYRLGPFAESSQVNALVKELNIKDYLIVEVSK